MMATLLLLFAVLDVSSSLASTPPSAYPGTALDIVAAPATPAGAAIAPSEVISYYAFIPLIQGQPPGCAPIPGVQYATLSVNGDPTDRPAELHGDLNLALRGYRATSAFLGLVDYGGYDDPKAPQLPTLFLDNRVPAFAAVYQVYDWDWTCNCRGELLTEYEVTLAGMRVAPGEVLRLPDSGYDIGSGYEAMVLYATEERITLKYTREDNVVRGYTLHVENVCVEPSLLALYRTWNDAGRGRLPALRAGQPFGRALSSEIGVAIRDTGTFMDPRSRQCWWLPR
jgi:hypothetical protein